jgi:hypothetical protein
MTDTPDAPLDERLDVQSLWQVPPSQRLPLPRPGHPADPRDTLAGRLLASIQDVLARGTQHVDDPRVHTAEPVVGCPWCIDEERATALHARMSKRWPDEWPALDTWEARVLCARGDLARSES